MIQRMLVATSLLIGGCTATVQTAGPQPVTGPAPVVVAPQKHPAYLHALTDLRTARSFLQRPAGIAVKWDENLAIREIDAAINEIKRAAIDDGKQIEEHPPIDVNLAWGGRLAKSMELIETARRDINQEEDNGFAQGLKNRAMTHIDRAAQFINEGVADAGRMGPTVVVVQQPQPQPVVVVQQPANAHPAYLHALTDLRVARGFLERPAGIVVKWDEKRAIHEIDESIREIKAAAIDDGKPLEDHPPVDVALNWGGRLGKALELVERSRGDINKEEDNPAARGLKNRAIGHIDHAAQFIKEGIEDARHMPAVVVVAPPATNDHPAYLHALSDLRAARFMLAKPAKPDVKWDENRGIREIDAAINEIKHAAIDDGKPLEDHPPLDTHISHKDRLRAAMELLHKAAADIDQREDNNFAKGLRKRANDHIRAAEHAVHEAVEERAHPQ